MIATPLAVHSPGAVREALRSHGWEEGLAASAAGGIQPYAVHLAGLDAAALEALVRTAGSLGLEVLTGEGWAVLAGSRSRLSAFARPWTVPEPLAPVALAVGLALPPDAPPPWRTARGALPLDRPLLMGILNVTPDSFSDGGRFTAPESALAQADGLVESGAAVLDVGGESTRPGRAEAVPADEELRRILPVIEALVRAHPEVAISVDTMKADVARAAVDAGAAIVNDVSGLRLDPAMAETVAATGAGLVLMHSRGGALELASYAHADYGADLVAAVLGELRAATEAAGTAGVAAEAIALDPGLGFSKTVEQSLRVLDQLPAFLSLGRPLLVGPSRKRFLGEITGHPVGRRDVATAAACALAWERGARIFRVHDVAAARDALAVAAALTPALA